MYFYNSLSTGLEKIEYLQEHRNKDIYDKASKIIQKYFQDRDDLEADGMIEPDASMDGYQFGASGGPQGGFALWYLSHGCDDTVYQKCLQYSGPIGKMVFVLWYLLSLLQYFYQRCLV